jgi:FkbH-like protein
MNFNQLKKNVKKDTQHFQTIRVAVLCDFASQFLVQALRGYGIEFGIDYEIFEADYNQIDRQVSDPSSEFYAFRPQYAVILRSSEKLLTDFYKTLPAERNEFANKHCAHTEYLYQAVSSRMDCPIIMNTYPEIDDNVFGNFGTRVRSSFLYQVKSLNLSLMDLARSGKRLFLADFNGTMGRIGFANSFDPKMYVHADMVYNLDVLPYLVKDVHDIVQALQGRFKKCLILDLDNTIWGGVIGDDGMEGIQLGDLGIGKAFTNLQLWVRELRNRGILIGVCSKNTEEIAREPFSDHPDMVLRLSDIAVFVANWENKVDNIRFIQRVLNISFDAMVFLDDNPFEREMVKQAIPEITVPSLPEDPSEYLVFLKGLNLFETVSFTEEDLARTEQYQVEAKRAAMQQRYESEDQFLESLQMRSEARAFDKFTIPRIAQLTQRSNQFNLRTKRYTEEEVGKFVPEAGYFTISFTLQDDLGDHGLISAIILQKKGQALFIDTWIMSCRVLKRGMENFVLNHIVSIARSNGFTSLTGEYIPTPKNGMVKNHYSDLGFVQDGELYTLAVADFQERKTFIKQK